MTRLFGRTRSLILAGAFFLFFASIAARLFALQIVEHPALAAKAEDRGRLEQELMPLRGTIFARRLQGAGIRETPIAMNKDVARVFADPTLIEEAQTAASALEPLLGRPAEELLPLLTKPKDAYEIMADNVPPAIVETIKKLKLPGIAIEYHTERFYPEHEDFGQVTGFLGYEGDERKGQYGIEGTYDDLLRGVSGTKAGQRGVSGALIATSEFSLSAPEHGSDIILTIDRALQRKSCEVLRSGVAEFEARGGTVLIMDPKTGAMLAMCSYPSFDPNEYHTVEQVRYFNNPALAPYEPGSVFKPITMAAAIDARVTNPRAVYEDTGSVTVNGYTITNAANKTFGRVTMTDVLDLSINTGAVSVALAVGRDLFKQYVADFGFGTKVNIGIAGEQPGDTASLNEKSDIYVATASYGHGITATPLQLARSFAVFANGGKLIDPYLIQEVRKPDGSIERHETQKENPQVIAPETAIIMSGMLASVTEHGYSKAAQVPGYYVAGKTGTALIPRSDARGYTDDSIHTFIGFAPVDDPQFVALVKLDAPGKGRFSSYTAAPLFAEVAQFALDYLGVAKER